MEGVFLKGGNCKITCIYCTNLNIDCSTIMIFFFQLFVKINFKIHFHEKKRKVGNQYICCMYMIIRESISVYAAMTDNKLKSISFFLLSQFSVFFWLWLIIIFKNCKKNPAHFFFAIHFPVQFSILIKLQCLYLSKMSSDF